MAQIDIQIEASLDDTFCWSSGQAETGNYVQFTYQGWVRFPIDIPIGATIITAYMEGCAYYSRSGSAGQTTRFQHSDEDNAVNFSSNPYSRAVSGPTVDYDFPATWTKNQWYATPEIKTIIQDFIDRAGYSQGNYIAIRGEPIDISTLYQWISWDYSPVKAAKLHIEYAVGGQYKKLIYTSEPPTPNAWNQIKQDAGTGWKKLLYEGE